MVEQKSSASTTITRLSSQRVALSSCTTSRTSYGYVHALSSRRYMQSTEYSHQLQAMDDSISARRWPSESVVSCSEKYCKGPPTAQDRTSQERRSKLCTCLFLSLAAQYCLSCGFSTLSNQSTRLSISLEASASRLLFWVVVRRTW